MSKKQGFTLLKRTVILITFLSMPSFLGSAQTTENQAELTIPSPNTAELGKYGSHPVGKYTGVPQISIPLYEMDFDGLKIPISLSYHAGGLRVSQEATWVGLGWSLSSNAVITRSILGRSDLGAGKATWNKYGYAFEDALPAQFDAQFEAYLESYSNYELTRDTQPDIFTASLFGKSIKFYLTQKQANEGVIETRQLGYSNDKVTYNEFDNSFTVIDTRGFTYEFKSKEYSTNISSASGEFTSMTIGQGTQAPTVVNYGESSNCLDGNYNSAIDAYIVTGWYLTSVTSPKNKVLNFNYKDDGVYVSVGNSHISESSEKTVCMSNVLGQARNAIIYSCSRSLNESLFQKEIINTSNNYKIEFNTSANRLDLLNYTNSGMYPINGYGSNLKDPQRLDDIKVKDADGNVVRDIKFTYGYFNDHLISDPEKERHLRLKLDKVVINGIEEYSFDYIEPNQLPNKLSKDVDFWGFYNGAQNNYRFPKYKFENVDCGGWPASSSEASYLEGAYRGSVFDFGKIGTLEKITYPTKGYSKFIYESNEVLIDRVQDATTFRYLSYNRLDIETTDHLLTNGQSFSYTVPSGETVVIDLNDPWNSLSFSCGYNCDNQWLVGDNFKIRNTTTSQDVYVKPYYFDELNDCSGNPLTCSSSFLDLLILEGGNTYSFESDDANATSGQQTIGFSMNFNVRLPVFEANVNDQVNFKVGGLRVKSIESYDDEGHIAGAKDYKYESTAYTPVIQSTGKLMNKLYYEEIVDRTGEEYSQYTDVGIRSGSKIGTENAAQGSHIGYSQVDEIFVGSTRLNDIGMIRTSFHNQPNITAQNTMNSIVYTDAPPFTFQISNGKIQNEKIFNSNSGIVKTDEYLYQKSTLATQKAYKTYYFQNRSELGIWGSANHGPISSILVWFNDIYGYYAYDLFQEEYLTTKLTSIEHFDNRNLISNQDYFYNSINQLRLTEKSTSDSQKIIKEFTYYPFDSEVSANTNTSELLANNQLDVPVRKETYSNTDLLISSETDFGINTNVGPNVVLPSAVKTKYSAFGSWINEAEFQQYDDDGNLQQALTRDGRVVSYLWGYDGEHLIAKIVGASYSDVAQWYNTEQGVSISNVITASNNDQDAVSENLLRTSLNDVRAAVEVHGTVPVQVTTYTYDPLIGLTSQTDPNGTTVYYEYDSIGRLEHVKDHENNILSKNQYHYKGQTSNP